MKMELYPYFSNCTGSGERSYFFDFRMIVGSGTLSYIVRYSVHKNRI